MNPQETAPLSTNPPAPVKLGKFKASRMLVRESLNVLRQDKELAWFPILSAITSLIALVVFFAVFFFTFMGGDINAFENREAEQLNAIGYLVLFAYYLLMFFIANYFLAGVYTIVHARFNGQDFSLSDGLANANRHIGSIFIWSLISATVGVVLRIIADRSKLIGNIVAMAFGAAWSILTYFSLPSLIIGQKSIKDSFKESASLIRRTWGETIIVNFGIGLFFALITFIVIAVMIGIAILVPTAEMVVVLSILFLIYIVALSIISSTLGSIVKLAIYEYATTGNVPQGFSAELIKGTIKSAT